MIIFSKENINTGDEMLHWAKQMWPFNRSLTGEGNRKTLKFIKSVVPKLKIKGVKSGTKVLASHSHIGLLAGMGGCF